MTENLVSCCQALDMVRCFENYLFKEFAHVTTLKPYLFSSYFFLDI